VTVTSLMGMWGDMMSGSVFRCWLDVGWMWVGWYRESVLGENGGFDMCVVDLVVPDQIGLITCSIHGRGMVGGCVWYRVGVGRDGGFSKLCDRPWVSG
jgi:hypothetical protein